MTDHPITPPPLNTVKEWLLSNGCDGLSVLEASAIATQAAHWGSDQELDACCGLLRQQGFDVVDDLRAARRPKPPSLKEQALGALSRADKDAPINPLTGEVVALRTILSKDQADTIRRALEQLDD